MNPDTQVVLVGALILAAIAAYEVRYMWRERRAVAEVERLIADFDSLTADALALAAELPPPVEEIGPIMAAAVERRLRLPEFARTLTEIKALPETEES